jgi:hypothetical protein
MRSGVPGNSPAASVLDARWTQQTLEGSGCIQDGPAHEPRPPRYFAAGYRSSGETSGFSPQR